MNEMIRKDCCTSVATEVAKNANVNITLEGWPLAVTVLEICATHAFVEWLRVRQQEKTIQKVPA